MKSDYEKENSMLAFPITCESTDLDGNWVLVSITKWLGSGKWLGYDEDGQDVVVDSATLSKPRL